MHFAFGFTLVVNIYSPGGTPRKIGGDRRPAS